MREISSDVVVVGSGAAGMMAALKSVLEGASVTLLEAAEVFGGTTAVSGGGMWMPRTRLAQEAGVEDSREQVKAYLDYLTRGVVAEAVIDQFIETAPMVIDYLERETVLEFYVDLERPDYRSSFPGALDYGRLVAPKLYELARLGDLLPLLRQPDWEARVKGDRSNGGMEAITQQEMAVFEAAGDPLGWVELARKRVAEGIVPRGCALIAAMLEVVAAKGARLVTQARACELIIESGRVAGVVAETREGMQRFTATSGVVLAAGGFEWNENLWRGLVRVPGVKPLSPHHNRGDNLLLAQQAGAQLALLDQVWWSVVAGGQPGQIVVNGSGRRFINECLTYNDYGKVLGYFDPHTYEFPNMPAYVISNRPLKLADTDINALGAQAGHVDNAEADTLRELAVKLGVDADGLSRRSMNSIAMPLRGMIRCFTEARRHGIDGGSSIRVCPTRLLLPSVGLVPTMRSVCRFVASVPKEARLSMSRRGSSTLRGSRSPACTGQGMVSPPHSGLHTLAAVERSLQRSPLDIWRGNPSPRTESGPHFPPVRGK